MSRSVHRFREYTIEPDTEPDAEAITFTVRCAVCGEGGPTAETTDAAGEWIVTHLGEKSEHLSYREIVTRPYRAVPGEWL
ncbi:DUF7848 domain-containing protein [Streptomyces alkaliphilus]|uniref:DUF7848 domain-containing protein n=1 Tax=Streptomyces alkaliphilus TaxID=1472722 RepID=UPI0011812BEE|nr:hypothetical protein [Streptomyces alkaliphilus]MQS07514.1 hypothetical protein [Streptomyces alkaliphilus]